MILVKLTPPLSTCRVNRECIFLPLLSGMDQFPGSASTWEFVRWCFLFQILEEMICREDNLAPGNKNQNIIIINNTKLLQGQSKMTAWINLRHLSIGNSNWLILKHNPGQLWRFIWFTSACIHGWDLICWIVNLRVGSKINILLIKDSHSGKTDQIDYRSFE